NVNAQDEYGDTALTQASQEGHCEIVKLLLNHGADKDIPGFKKYTPLIIAAENGHTHVVSVLIENGANVNAQTEDGST
ncbi:ankyrin, partial [Gymnopus androsaceus JB14]